MKTPPSRGWRARWLWWSASLLALVLVFATYQQPDLMFELANYVWSCF